MKITAATLSRWPIGYGMARANVDRHDVYSVSLYLAGMAIG